MGGYRPRPRPNTWPSGPSYQPTMPDPDRARMRHDARCDTPGCPCQGEMRDWCIGCDNTPVRNLMVWTADGRYLCRTCAKGDEAPAPPVASLMHAVAARASEAEAREMLNAYGL